MMTRFLSLTLVLASFSTLSAGEELSPVEAAFTKIYSKGEWGKDKNGNGTSGWGSTIKEALPYKDFLTTFLKKKKIKSVVDVGCGDWQFSKKIKWKGIHYIGYDIVKEIIDRNNQNYARSNITFVHGNGVSADLPEADLLVCKDVLQHLSNETILTFLAQLPKFKYCLLTNDSDDESPELNSEFVDGSVTSRPLDLTLAPFAIDGKKVLHYQSGANQKQVLLIINKKTAL